MAQVRDNPVRARVRGGELCFGTMVFEVRSPGLPQILARAGAEFVIYDLETAGFDLAEVRTQIALTRGTALVPVVRVPNLDARFVARVLDCGALGVMLPMVEDAAQAEAFVRATRFPPRGDRGATAGQAHDDYLAGDAVAKMAAEDARVLTIAQIESARGVENAGAIAAVEDIDVLWIGPNDLSLSLGVPGQFEAPVFREAVAKVVAACRACGKAAGCGARDAQAAGAAIAEGFTVMTVASDVQLLLGGLGREMAGIRRTLQKTQVETGR